MIVSTILLVVGIAAAVLGFTTAPLRAKAAFITNFVYFGGVAQGAFIFAVAMVITRCRWGRPLKRLAEVMGLFLIPMYILLIIFLLSGGLSVYPWMHEALPPHKTIYLSEPFFVARQVVGIGLLIFLDLALIRASWRSDLGVAAKRLGNKAPSWWGSLIADWKGDEAEIAANMRRQITVAPMIAICYALVWSMVAVDISMSLAPHWYANMFPAWYFMSSFWSGLVYIGILSLVLRDWLGITGLLRPNVYHDLGKLIFGLCMFWGYTTYATYLAIWYGNMTEEIGYILLRTEIEPWATLSRVVVVMCFLMPFGMLLSRGLKKIPVAFMSALSIIAVGVWLERFLVVTPSIWMEDTLPLGPLEVCMALGFLGAFVGFVAKIMAQLPPVPFTDEMMNPDPEHIHVHPAHAHH